MFILRNNLHNLAFTSFLHVKVQVTHSIEYPVHVLLSFIHEDRKKKTNKGTNGCQKTDFGINDAYSHCPFRLSVPAKIISEKIEKFFF